MSYLTQARLAGDTHILLRVTACAATEKAPTPSSGRKLRRGSCPRSPGGMRPTRPRSRLATKSQARTRESSLTG